MFRDDEIDDDFEIETASIPKHFRMERDTREVRVPFSSPEAKPTRTLTCTLDELLLFKQRSRIQQIRRIV